MSFFVAIIYFSILFFFGWQLARYVLKEDRIEHLLGLSGIFGVGLYVFLINAAGFFIPIKTAFYFVLFLFLVLALFCFGKLKPVKWGIDEKWRRIVLLFALFLVVSTGIISFRHEMDLSILREPTAATIAEGNFPPREIWQPEHRLAYHYGPDLFSAAIHKVTRLPLYAAYDFQKGILAGVLFLLGFILVKRFSSSDFKAFISALLMLYAGTLAFLRGLEGIPVLYNKYILGHDIPGAFKFVSDAIEIGYASPVIRFLVGLHWGAMAFPLLIVVIYLYFRLVDGKVRIMAFPVCGFLLALLALVSEPYFAVLSFVLFVYPCVFGLIKKDLEKTKKFLFTSLLILLIVLPIVFLQGGVVKEIVFQQLDVFSEKESLAIITGHGDDRLFALSPPWILFDSRPIYHPEFLIAWGLLIAVLIPSFIFLFRKYCELALFLFGVVVLSFSIPLVVTSSYSTMAGQLERFFYPVNLLGGLVVGFLMGNLYLHLQMRKWKWVLIVFLFMLTAQGLWTQSVWLLFGNPPGTWNPNEKLFADPYSVEGRGYQWVKKNTSINDYFLIIKEEYTECGFTGAPNCLFILNTGRIAPIYNHQLYTSQQRASGLFSKPEVSLFNTIKQSCSSSHVQKLNYRYLFVDEKWPEGMEQRCLENNTLEIKFEAKEGDSFIRIYRIKRGDE